MRLSPSQIKTFCASKAKRAGQYILWIKDEFQNDAFDLWQCFEYYLLNQKDWLDFILEWKTLLDFDKFIWDYDTLKINSEWLNFEKWQSQVKVEWELFGSEFMGYVDNLTEDWIDDIKTCRYLTKQDNASENMRSGMPTMDEYKLQLWIYCKLLWRTKARIIEICKHPYKDKRQWRQIIEFDFSNDKDMVEKYEPIIKEMQFLYNKYKKQQWRIKDKD